MRELQCIRHCRVLDCFIFHSLLFLSFPTTQDRQLHGEASEPPRIPKGLLPFPSRIIELGVRAE